MWLIKLPLKLLMLPLLLVLAVLHILGRVFTHLSAYVVGTFLFLVALICVYCIVRQQWTNLLILGSVEILALAMQFGAMWLVELCSGLNRRLCGFLRS